MSNVIDDYTEVYRQSIQTWFNDSLHKYFNGNRFHEEIFSNILVTVCVYWTVGFLYSAFDLTGKPKFFLRYKVQPLENTQVSKDNLLSLFKQILMNQIMVSFIGAALLFLKHELTKVQTQIPTLSRFVVEWIAFILIREILFYYSHRLLHHPRLYRHIHKRHHEWQTPVALTAIYCHPIEHIVANFLPVIIGPVLMDSHSLVSSLWMLWVIILTLNDHSGYHFPLFFPPIFHDFHHLK